MFSHRAVPLLTFFSKKSRLHSWASGSSEDLFGLVCLAVRFFFERRLPTRGVFVDDGGRIAVDGSLGLYFNSARMYTGAFIKNFTV